MYLLSTENYSLNISKYLPILFLKKGAIHFMTDYRKLYLTLFNGITDALELIDALDILGAKELLISLQQKTEDMFIDDED